MPLPTPRHYRRFLLALSGATFFAMASVFVLAQAPAEERSPSPSPTPEARPVVPPGIELSGTPQDGYLLPLIAPAYELPKWNTSVGRDESDGSLRLHTKQRDWHQMISYRAKFDGRPVKVVFTGRMKTDNVAGGGEYIEAARAQIVFNDKSGGIVGGWPGGTVKNGTTPWAEFRQELTVPAGADSLTVMLGLYISTGQANFKDLKLQAFDAEGKPVALSRAPNEERTDTTGWWTFVPGTPDLTRPAVFDFSRYIPAPSGEFGFVEVRDGHFMFEEGGRARFWGTGATTDFPTSREEAERTAAGLPAKGINLVRFHGLDYHDAGENLFKESEGTTQTLDPDKLDRFGHYLAQLKKHGVYANINLAVYRRFTEKDGVKDANKLTTGGGAAMYFDRRLIELQKDHATKLMTWLNPHTGLALKEDPTIAMIELKNEASLFLLDFMGGIPQSYIDDLDKLFTAYCEQEKITRPSGSIRELLKKRDLTAAKFAQNVMTDYTQEMMAHLRSIGVRVPVSVTQFQTILADVEAHATADYIDRHDYWDTPLGGWDPKATFHNRSMVKTARKNAGLLGNLATPRWIGKPYTVSEWGFCYPNEWIAEGPMTVAAFASFQDWDGPMVFLVDHPRWTDKLGGCFDIETMPHVMGPMHTAALLFYRGDVAPGPLLARSIAPDKLGKDSEDLFTADEIMTRRVAVGADVDEPAAGPTGLSWTPGLFVVDTPRSQGYVGEAGKGVTCGDLVFTSSMPFAQVFATSLDDQPLAKTSRFVISLAARAENTGQVFKEFRRGLVKLGAAPILIEPVKAQVTLKRADKPTVYVVDAHGRRTTETVPVVAAESGGWTLDLSGVKALWVEVVYS